ncbi:MAG: transposase [Bacteriovoracaceae bacterium]
MDQVILDQIEKIKKQIENANKGNHSSRRRFPKLVKKKLCHLVLEKNLSTAEVSELVGVSQSALGKWIAQTQAPQFREVKVKSFPSKKVSKKKSLDKMGVTQLTLLTLQALLIIERLFLR